MERSHHLLLGESFNRISPYLGLGPLFITIIIILLMTVSFLIENELSFFISQLWIFLTILAIFWVLLSIDFGYRSYLKYYEGGIKVHKLSRDNIQQFREKAFNEKSVSLRIVLPINLVFEGYIFLTKLKILPVSPTIYDHIYLKPVVLISFMALAFFVGYIYGIGANLSLNHVAFVKWLFLNHKIDIRFVDLGNFDLVESRLSEIYDIGKFSVSISVMWLIGLTISYIIIVSFLQVLDFYTAIFLLFSTVFGVMIYVIPEMYIHKSLQQTKQSIKDETLRLIQRRINTKHIIIDNVDEYITDLAAAYYVLDHLGGLRVWSVNYTQIVQEVLGVLIPIMGFILTAHP